MGKKNILGFFGRKTSLELYWWRYDTSEHGNFGDEITRLIIERIFHRTCVWAPMESCKIIGAGSLLQDVVVETKNNNPYIWGTGFIEDGARTIDGQRFRILGVRGELSKKRIANYDGPIFLGDPGLLASRAVRASQKKYILGIIPHYVDKNNSTIDDIRKKFENPEDVIVIDATSDCEDVLRQISACSFILSSSLHGLIVADSYGVPNSHLVLSNQVRGGDYKFIDYFSVFPNRKYASISHEDVLSKSANDIINLIQSSYIPPSNLEQVQDSIIRAFPF